jgi:dipeptidyl aminopeptidase/acylaminoacyl peptidase
VKDGHLTRNTRRVVVSALWILASSLAVGAPEPTGVPAPVAALPVEYFTRYDEIGGLKVSPTGEYVAYMTGAYGRSMVVVLDLKEKKVTGGVRCPGNFEILDLDWVSRTRLTYKLAERWPGMATPVATGEIMAMNFDGSGQKLIYGFRAGESPTATNLRVREASYATPELISTLKVDDDDILIAEYLWRHHTTGWYYDPDAKPSVYRLNVFNARKNYVAAAPLAGATVLVDRNDNVRFAIGRDKALKMAVSWKPDLKSDWTAFELPGFREESVQPRVFGEDNQSVLLTGVREGETYAALFSLDLKSRDVTKVFAFDQASVSGLVFDFTGTRAIGVTGYTDKPIYHWLDGEDRAARLYKALFRAFPGQQVSVTSTSDDGRLAVVLVDADINPGDYYLFDVQTMNASHLQAARRWVDPARMRPKTPFTMKARDGLELHGYVTRPAGEGPFPLVVLPHGGPHGIRDIWGFDWEVQLLANRGFAVLQVNYRGSGGYGMDFGVAGYREWGARMQDDITDATRWAIEEKIAAPDRICIFGASYGGFAALMGAVREPKLYRCAIGYAGIYDLELMLTSADIPRSRSGRAYLDKALGGDPAELRSRSPVHNAQRIESPVLLIHGKEDWRADFAQAKRMKEALESNHKPFEWMALSREGHGVYDEETRREVYERVLRFLERNLAPASATREQ